MKDIFLDLIKGVLLGFLFAGVVLLIATMNRFAYANGVHPHGELALVGYEYLAHSPLNAVFLCVISMRSHVMAKLWRDTFECASYLDYWSTNPLQLCHLNYLVVIGKAPVMNLGAH